LIRATEYFEEAAGEGETNHPSFRAKKPQKSEAQTPKPTGGKPS
jgi:hypothetical protein